MAGTMEIMRRSLPEILGREPRPEEWRIYALELERMVDTYAAMLKDALAVKLPEPIVTKRERG